MMLTRVQFATYVFALHAPGHSLCAQPHSQALRHQPPSRWILGCSVRLIL